jgi:ABC-2 type transport system permease protein
MNTTVIFTLVKRELWEHRTRLIITPLATSVFVVLTLFLASGIFNRVIDQNGLGMNGDLSEWMANSDSQREMVRGIDFNNLESFSAQGNHEGFFGLPIMGAVAINSLLVALEFLLVLTIYAHGCLFDDRKNRDILFWRSMPVSERTNVLVKLGMLVAYAPAVIFALNLVVGIIALMTSVIFFAAKGVAITTILTSIVHSGALTMVFKIFAASLLTLIVLTPISSFFLLCSALATQSPVMTSSLIPIALLVIDKTLSWIFGIHLHIAELFKAYWQVVMRVSQLFSPGQASTLDASSLFTCVIALLVAAAFTGGAIWLRDHRYEI